MRLGEGEDWRGGGNFCAGASSSIEGVGYIQMVRMANTVIVRVWYLSE